MRNYKIGDTSLLSRGLFMKKMFWGLGLLIFTLLLGCTSTYRRYDIKTPVDERSLVEFPNRVTATEFDGERVYWGGKHAYISIPAGTHTFNIDYRVSYQVGNTVYLQSSYDNIIEHTFEPGIHYIFNTERFQQDGEDYVRIWLSAEGNDTGSFDHGVYSGFHGHLNIGSGATSARVFSLDFNIQPPGYVHDGKVRWDLYLDLGLDIGFSAPFGAGPGAHGGLFGKFFCPGTTFGIGAGGGYRGEMYFLMLETNDRNQNHATDIFYYPYARAAIFPPTKREWSIYFEYYFDSTSILPDDLTYYPGSLKKRKWGVGVNFVDLFGY
jgi:hypothetical protein